MCAKMKCVKSVPRSLSTSDPMDRLQPLGRTSMSTLYTVKELRKGQVRLSLCMYFLNNTLTECLMSICAFVEVKLHIL